MTDVKAGVEYKINIKGNSFLLDSKKYLLLESILDTNSLTEAAKEINVSEVPDGLIRINMRARDTSGHEAYVYTSAYKDVTPPEVRIIEPLINAPLNRNYEIGDKILALISYDNIFLMLEPQTSSIRNILKGQIVEMKLENEIIRVKIDVGGIILCSDITVSAEKELNLNIGTEVYVGFKAMSVATLKL